jgi:hypothetical protein
VLLSLQLEVKAFSLMLGDHLDDGLLRTLKACVKADSPTVVEGFAAGRSLQRFFSKLGLLCLQALEKHLDPHAGVFGPEPAPVSGF